MKKTLTANGIEANGKDARLVHKLVRQHAKEMAGAYYELAARSDNEFYRQYPSQKQYIQSCWKHFVVEVRKMMASRLGNSATTSDEKVQIYEALQLHNELPWSMQENQIINVPH